MILVFGTTGQVAKELQIFSDVQGLQRWQADLSDPQACVEAIKSYKPRAVINAAAFTSVDKAEDEIDLAKIINGIAPGAMAAACADLHIPLVHISTDYVFDGTGTKPWSVTDIPRPQNAYGISKLIGEQEIQASGCNYAILRTSWVVSAHRSNFIKTILSLSKTRDCLSIVDDQVGGPTCARDIAQTCVAIADQLAADPSKSGVYHYTGQPDVSWCQFAIAICEQIGCKTQVNPLTTFEYPTRAIRPLNSRLDCSATQDVFGISRPAWHDGLKEILQELEYEHEKS